MRERRGSEEVRGLILDAARDLFTANGYRAATTKEIAAKAGVAEPLLFRNFGSKAELFQATVVAPFSEFIEEYVRTWEHQSSATTPEELVGEWVRGFYELVRRNRDLLLSLIAAKVHDGDALGDLAEEISHQFAAALRPMQRVALEEGAARHYEGMDPPATMAAVSGMVLSMVLLDEWLFPAGKRRPARDRQIEEIVTMILHGIAHRERHEV